MWRLPCHAAIVEISASSSADDATGSGVVITGDGEIVTNNHVISGASTIKVALSTGKTYTADVVGTDADKDLALIKLQGASGLKTATLGDSSSVKVGDEVVAIGSPEGLTGTVTSGIVSALDRDVTVAKEEQQEQQQQQGGQNWPFEFGGQQFNGETGTSKTTYKALQTDASLNPGNSGGALINMNGEIIGINSAMYSPSSASSSGSSAAGSVGLGFAIPVDTVKADLDTLRRLTAPDQEVTMNPDTTDTGPSGLSLPLALAAELAAPAPSASAPRPPELRTGTSRTRRAARRRANAVRG